MFAQISESFWMWILGGTCGFIVLLISALGGFILSSIIKIKEEIKAFRIEFAESKINLVTWPSFSDVKREMEKDRQTEIKLALSEHLESYQHGKKA